MEVKIPAKNIIIKVLFLIILMNCIPLVAQASGYIVKLKADVVILFSDNIEPIIPELSLYRTDDIIDESMCEYIEEDVEVSLFDTYDYSTVEKNLYQIKQSEILPMWNIGCYGKDIKIGVIDSGCNPHVALENNIVGGHNYVDDTEDICDNIGHGTAVAGLIASKYGVRQSIGTAYKSNVVSLKIVDENDEGKKVGGKLAQVLGALEGAVDDYECDIINMSLGMENHSKALEEAVNYAVSKGAIITAAVGNSADSTYIYPAMYENVIGVGGVNSSKEHYSKSNTNSSVFVCAAAENVGTLSSTNAYKTSSGTSYASPIVAGIIADMKCIKPDITLDEIKKILSETSEDLGEGGYDTKYGHGLINCSNIVKNMLNDKKYFVSQRDICDEDGVDEIRVRKSDNAPIITIWKENEFDFHIEEPVFDDEYVTVIRFEAGQKCFIWDSLKTMNPII